MRVRTNRWTHEISPNGDGTGFVVERQRGVEGATDRHFGKILAINMRERTLALDETFFICGVISIEEKMKIRTNHAVYEVALSGNGNDFVVEKLEDVEGVACAATVSHFEGKVLTIDMNKKTLLLNAGTGFFGVGFFSIRGIISIES